MPTVFLFVTLSSKPITALTDFPPLTLHKTIIGDGEGKGQRESQETWSKASGIADGMRTLPIKLPLLSKQMLSPSYIHSNINIAYIFKMFNLIQTKVNEDILQNHWRFWNVFVCFKYIFKFLLHFICSHYFLIWSLQLLK
jgi:hypothetical protein